MKLFAGTSNPQLAQAIAEKLSLPLNPIEIVRFADSECRVRIAQKVDDVKAVVIQSLSNPTDNHLIELTLIADALRSYEVEKITAVIPFLGYSRQDRAHRSGEAISARVAAKLLQAAGITKVMTVDLHSEAAAGFYQVPLMNLFGLSLFKEALPKGDIVIASPDAGGMKRAQKFAHEMGLPLCFIEKKRDLDKMHQTDVVRVVGDVRDKTTVIVDDIVTSGGTLVKAAYLLKEHGAKAVWAFVTHPDFVATTATILMDSPIEKIFTTDTIPVPNEWKFPKLTILSVAPLIADALQ